MIDWQTAVALALVAVAGVYVLRRMKATLAGGSSSCGSCSSCPSNTTSNLQSESTTGKRISLVQISAPHQNE